MVELFDERNVNRFCQRLRCRARFPGQTHLHFDAEQSQQVGVAPAVVELFVPDASLFDKFNACRRRVAKFPPDTSRLLVLEYRRNRTTISSVLSDCPA